MNAFYEIYNSDDTCVKEALKLIGKGEASVPVSFGTDKSASDAKKTK